MLHGSQGVTKSIVLWSPNLNNGEGDVVVDGLCEGVGEVDPVESEGLGWKIWLGRVADVALTAATVHSQTWLQDEDKHMKHERCVSFITGK